MVKISFIVPVYKVPIQYLRECLDSLIAQPSQEFEFIVVSDGAPETECSVCEQYTANDSRFKFYKRDHAGVSAARNVGIDQARGDFITFVDCDDWVSPDISNTFGASTESNDSDLILMNSVKIWDNQKKLLLFKFKNEIKKTCLEHIPHLAICGYFFKKSIIKQNAIRFNESLFLSEDKAFIYHYFCHCKSIKTINTPIYYYRQHNLSVTHQDTTIITLEQQIKAAQHIYIILKENSCKSNVFIVFLTNRMIQMAIVDYIKKGYDKKRATTVKDLYKKIVGGSNLRYLYIWNRAKLTALLGNILHL